MSWVPQLRQHLTITSAVSLLLAVAIVVDAVSMYHGSFSRSVQEPTRVLPTLARRPSRSDLAVVVNAHLFGKSAVTELPGSEAEKEQALKLTGTIVWEDDASRSLAMVGPSEHQTQVLKIGMGLGSDVRLSQVFHDHVSLMRDGTALVVTLPRNTSLKGSKPLVDLLAAETPDSASLNENPDEPPDTSRQMVPASLIVSRDLQGRVARMQNESSETLTFRITSKDSKTGSNSMVEVTIPPKRWSRLTDAGLVIGSGDEVTIESPPYRARSISLQ
jgi:hypothetical protein